MVVGSRRLAVTHAGRRRTWSVSWRTLALVGDIGTGRFITGYGLSRWTEHPHCTAIPPSNALLTSLARFWGFFDRYVWRETDIEGL
jgi:hypothetical protein